ncbi:MAG: AraC family transcriptional regulator [Saccharospirillaceae bacterium]|nr:AraC family transcriptional regulator [Pseudomonadales bacterium]NRB77992.1 AraC family transcriptional regulator [Saccharospirillaceae bacterium]
MKVKDLIKSIIQCIDEMPNELLTVNNVALKIGYSRWQLQRTFSVIFQLSLSDYIRLYKLSNCAKQLVESTDSIICIAIEHGFTSQSAFSRSFKNEFKVSPNQYRQQQLQPTGLLPILNFEYELAWDKSMIIKVEHKSEFQIVGVSGYFNPLGSDNPNNFEVIPKIWQKFCEIENEQETTKMGVIYDSDNSSLGEMCYLAGSTAVKAPNNLSVKVINEGLFAILPHIGLITELAVTMDSFYGAWLPESKYKMRGNEVIEVYDKRFNALSKSSYFETWIPIKLE